MKVIDAKDKFPLSEKDNPYLKQFKYKERKKADSVPSPIPSDIGVVWRYEASNPRLEIPQQEAREEYRQEIRGQFEDELREEAREEASTPTSLRDVLPPSTLRPNYDWQRRALEDHNKLQQLQETVNQVVQLVSRGGMTENEAKRIIESSSEALKKIKERRRHIETSPLVEREDALDAYSYYHRIFGDAENPTFFEKYHIEISLFALIIGCLMIAILPWVK